MDDEITDDQIDEAYEAFAAVPPEEWDSGASEKILEDLRSKGHEGAADDLETPELTANLRVLGKVASEYDREAFEDTLREGELPPLELSSEEMEQVRGGLAVTAGVIVGSAALVAAGYAFETAMDD